MQLRISEAQQNQKNIDLTWYLIYHIVDHYWRKTNAIFSENALCIFAKNYYYLS
jgi:hypothetical protein